MTEEQLIKNRERNKQWRLANPERSRELSRNNHKKHKEKWAATRKLTGAPRKAKLWERYGLTVEKYDSMLSFQEGKCAICRKSPEENKSPLCVDHCHETGKVRGLLCRACNSGVGYFSDDPLLFREAANYVEHFSKAGNDNGIVPSFRSKYQEIHPSSELLARLIQYVSEKKRYDVVSAANCRQNGYHSIAAKHENEAQFAQLILEDLYAEQSTHD